ncbi:ABC-2 family transporter protein [Bacillus sp. THAF10]|uniref:ABC transporter permease n=1 Tax=Bacillus sp. THAF10 TaxID=2587848 RepID=UPI001267FB5F|nr:ABC transporter permease [Bacillus sp. THAF10]QFT88252.1 ABC-2 family transporter protein [Bacillus sp. THAF10]
MNKFLIILLHTYMSKLKSKSFIISTLVTTVLILGLSNIQSIIDIFDKEEEKVIGLLAEDQEMVQRLEQQQSLVPNNLLQIEKVQSEAEAEEKVTNGEYVGFLIVTADSEGLPSGTFKAASITDTETLMQVESMLQQVKNEMATSKLGLTQEQIAQLYTPISFDVMPLEDSAKSAEELDQARGLVYVLLFVIYFSVILYASMIATEVAVEKSSRVMEILISSASPIMHMFGKILGIALLSLTQLSFWILIGYFSLSRNLDGMAEAGGVFEYFGVGDLPVSTFVYAVVFFLLGYFLYATFAAFLGSLVSRIEEIQQIILPMTLLIVAGFMISMFGLGDPENSFIQVTSFIPFFAPMIMFLRVGMLNVPMWEIAVAIGLLISTIILLAWFGAKVYRGGVLMYGKSSSLKDIKKALQLTREK